MTQILQFPHSAIAFDPETIKIVSLAFDDAWKKIQKSGSKFAGPAYAKYAKKSPSTSSIALGAAKENSLTEDAVQFLAANYRY